MKSVLGGVTTYYSSDLVEVKGGVITKYYYADGQRIAMHDDTNAPAHFLGGH